MLLIPFITYSMNTGTSSPSSSKWNTPFQKEIRVEPKKYISFKSHTLNVRKHNVNLFSLADLYNKIPIISFAV